MCCIASEGSCDTIPGKPYESSCMGFHVNVHSSLISFPYIISTYFDSCGIIDIQNQQPQFELDLEKYWVAKDPYFSLVMIIFVVCITVCCRV